jgi:hypothetical protein
MTKLTSLAFGAALALASIGIAHADGTVDGAWKLTVGAYDAPCTLNLATDGSIAAGADCPTGLNTVATWKTTGNGIQLYSGSGDLVASLKPKGDSYIGTRFTDGRKLALSR